MTICILSAGGRSCASAFDLFDLTTARTWLTDRSSSSLLYYLIIILNVSSTIGSIHYSLQSWTVSSRSRQKNIKTIISRSSGQTIQLGFRAKTQFRLNNIPLLLMENPIKTYFLRPTQRMSTSSPKIKAMIPSSPRSSRREEQRRVAIFCLILWKLLHPILWQLSSGDANGMLMFEPGTWLTLKHSKGARRNMPFD